MNHDVVNIIEKDNEYQKRKNLEIPTKPKGNSFAVLDFDVLGDMTDTVNLNIGVDESNREHFIANMVSKEIDKNLAFVSENPETVLPLVDTFNGHFHHHDKDFPPLQSSVGGTQLPGSSQQCDEDWKVVVSDTSPMYL
jgi:hypothetical protein